MGCDIHLFIEEESSGSWWFKSEYTVGRNYRLFAALADVRNGSGFAGCNTGDPILPIAPTRGLPEDASYRTKSSYKEWAGDAHSASWLLLSELLAYDWDREIVIRGYVPEDVYLKMRDERHEPDSWSGFTSGSQIMALTAAQYEALGEKRNDREYLIAHHRSNPYHLPTANPLNLVVQAEWRKKLSDMVCYFLDHDLAAWKSMGEPEKIRIVFWFDN